MIQSFCRQEAVFDEFGNFLISKHIIHERKVSYYINWVSKCLNSSKKASGAQFSSAEIDQFLKKLSKNKEQWQVDQAALAIRIYQYFVKDKRAPVQYDSIDDRQQWRFVADEMKNMLG